MRSHRAAAHRVVTRIERVNRAACGPAVALRLPEVEESANEAVSALGERRIAAQRRNRQGGRSGRWRQAEIGPDANVIRQGVGLGVSLGPSADRTYTRQVRCVRDVIDSCFRRSGGRYGKPIEGP